MLTFTTTTIPHIGSAYALLYACIDNVIATQSDLLLCNAHAATQIFYLGLLHVGT
jgi:hypothetical protein